MLQTKGPIVIQPDEGIRDSHHGFQRSWGITGTNTGTQTLSMAYGTLKPGTKAEPHYHPFDTAIYHIRGTVRLFYGDHLENEVIVGPGAFLYLPAGVVHSPECIGDEQLEYVVSRNAPEDKYYLPGQQPDGE